jgi:hypothetical protein
MIVSYRAFDEIVDFITSGPRPEQILAFQPSAQSVKRLKELVQKNQEGDLGEKEKHELQQFMLIEHLMRLAKARARQRLAA